MASTQRATEPHWCTSWTWSVSRSNAPLLSSLHNKILLFRSDTQPNRRQRCHLNKRRVNCRWLQGSETVPKIGPSRNWHWPPPNQPSRNVNSARDPKRNKITLSCQLSMLDHITKLNEWNELNRLNYERSRLLPQSTETHPHQEIRQISRPPADHLQYKAPLQQQQPALPFKDNLQNPQKPQGVPESIPPKHGVKKSIKYDVLLTSTLEKWVLNLCGVDFGQE